MEIKELEDIMITHSVVLRAIPKKVVGVYEKQHIDSYPTGTIQYLERYKREMLVVESIPKNAGKFIFECQRNTSSSVHFSGKKFFDSIEEAVADLLESSAKKQA